MFVDWLTNKWTNLFKFPSFTTSLPPKKISTLVIANAGTSTSDINIPTTGNAYNLLLVELPDTTTTGNNNAMNSDNIIIQNYYNINKPYRHLVLLLDSFPDEPDLSTMLNIIFDRLPTTRSLSRTLYSSRCNIDQLPKVLMIVKSLSTSSILTEDILNYILTLYIYIDKNEVKYLLRLIKLRAQKFTVVFT